MGPEHNDCYVEMLATMFSNARNDDIERISEDVADELIELGCGIKRAYELSKKYKAEIIKLAEGNLVNEYRNYPNTKFDDTQRFLRIAKNKIVKLIEQREDLP